MKMDWSYAAGFIDGEGSMGFAMDARTVGNSILPYITLTQAEKYRGFRAVQELAALMESEGIKTYVYVTDHRGRATTRGGPFMRNYRTIKLHVRSYENIILALRKLIPHLVVRKNSAEDLLRFLILYPPRTGKNAKRYRPKRIAGLRLEPSKLAERVRGPQPL